MRLSTTKTITALILALTHYSCTNTSEKDSKRSVPAFKAPSERQNSDSDPNYNIDKGRLGETQQLKVSFAGVNGISPQWVIDSPENQLDHGNMIYLEQANYSIFNSDTLYTGFSEPGYLLLEGQFYSKAGYPMNFKPRKSVYPTPSRVFRYSSLKIILNTN